jgi:hypothetical protein
MEVRQMAVRHGWRKSICLAHRTRSSGRIQKNFARRAIFAWNAGRNEAASFLFKPMKKFVYVATLVAAAAGLFAFLPKEGETTGYMMVISRASADDGTVAVVSPDGKVGGGAVTIDRKSNVSPRSQVHAAALLKLNELRQSNWHVVEAPATMTYHGMGETAYLLEQR